MRRLAAILFLLGGLGLLAATAGADGEGEGTGDYEVRAIFDNGGFIVPGEEVRIAGAKVGTVSEVDVTAADDPAHEDGSADPGKAVIVMSIDDPAFQDFRTDASCLIRPQSLLGERFVECEPTQPRAAASEIPPELSEIEDGAPGEGQHFLPVEGTAKAIDLDLVNNIMEEPYPDRFRLILNDLGAGFAARGKDLGEIIDRANPALRETNEVLDILADQNDRLADLATDGDRSLAPLARERESLVGFIQQSTIAAQATAERREELEAGFERLPAFLRELRLTMPELRAFSEEAEPAVAALGDAAPAVTRATRALGPFSEAGTEALTSLGDAAQESGDEIEASDPILVDLRDLARRTAPGARSLAALLSTFRRTNGIDYLTRFIYFSVGITNGFDSRGHFLRALLPLNNCVDYEQQQEAGCGADFVDTSTALATARTQDSALKSAMARLARRSAAGERQAQGSAEKQDTAEPPDDSGPVGEEAIRQGATKTLLEFLMGPDAGGAP